MYFPMNHRQGETNPMNDKAKMLEQIQQTILEISARQKRSFIQESVVLQYLCANPHATPGALAAIIAQDAPFAEEDLEITEYTVKRTFRACKLPREQEEKSRMAGAAWKAGQTLAKMTMGQADNLAQYRREASPVLRSAQGGRMILVSMFAAKKLPFPENIRSAVMRLNRDFSAECLESITDILESGAGTDAAPVNEAEQLRTALLRSRELVENLQEDFDNRLEVSKAEEQERFFSQLNDARYGHILDMLAVAQDGFKRLRAKGTSVPMEIRGIQTLVRRLLEFVDDFGVTPMETVGVRREVSADDLLEMQFEGSPFMNPEERKTVEVISPGWEIKDRDVVISYPRVREVLEDA